MQIPERIRLVTIATCSLPPLCCAAWLVGDERQIAKDAVVWIPKLPERVLREGQRGALCYASNKMSPDSGEESEESYNSEDAADCRRPHSSNISASKRSRIDLDLRTLADVLNEWFPTWEFNGSYLDFDDLLAWEVVRPEWGFGGRAARTRQPQAVSSGTRRGGRKSSVMDAQPSAQESSEEARAPKPNDSRREFPMPKEEA